MKKRKIIVIVLTILNVILFTGGIVGAICTSKNNKIINSTNREFSYYEQDNEIELALDNNEKVKLKFGNNAVKVIDSSKISKENSLYIISFISSYAEQNGIELSRTNVNLMGEYRLHTYLYKVGYKVNQTKDADLEYTQDDRWYVRFVSEIIGWLGI